MEPQLLQHLSRKTESAVSVQEWQDSLLQSYLNLPVRRIEDIVRIERPVALAVIRKQMGDLKVKALLSIMIIDLLDFFSVGKSMGEQQIAYTVTLIQSDYYYFTVEDFKVFFDNCKRGKYGVIYGRIDGNVILGWLEHYDQDRAIAFSSHNDVASFSDKDRFVRRGDPVKICDKEINIALRKFKK